MCLLLYLIDLGFEIVSKKSISEIKLKVPTYRYDVTREVDVFEEILRIYGYNNIPSSNKISFPLNLNSDTFKNFDLKNKVSSSLCNSGFFEIKNNSLNSYELLNKIHKQDNLVKILNASSNDLNVLRRSIFSNLAIHLKKNQDRGYEDISLFEIGPSFFGKNPGEQQIVVGALRSGKVGRKRSHSTIC